MVTSAVAGEGKSTTVANLGVAFAQAGRKVLLVDLDFRRSSLARFFGIDPKRGLADVITGSARVGDVVTSSRRSPSRTKPQTITQPTRATRRRALQTDDPKPSTGRRTNS
jgi:Mrp family chromosome partitioning ATPase